MPFVSDTIRRISEWVSLDEAIKNLGPLNEVLLIDRPAVVTANTTVPSNILTVLEDDGRVNIPAGLTLTFSGSVFILTNATAFTGNGTLTISGVVTTGIVNPYAGTLTVNVAGATTIITGNLHAQGTGPHRFDGDVLVANSKRVDFSDGLPGTTRALTGIAAGVDSIIVGSAAGDLCFRANTRDILLSGDGGGTAHVRISATGVVTFAPANGLRINTGAHPIINREGANDLSFGTNGVERFRVSASAMTLTGDLVWANVNPSVGPTSANDLRLVTNNVIRMALRSGGQINMGTGTVTTGAAAGEIIYTNGTGARSINAAATNTYGLIRGGASDAVYIGSDGNPIIAFGPVPSLAGAAGGDLLLQNAKIVRFLNQAGSSSANFGLFSTTGNELEFRVPGAATEFRWYMGGAQRLALGDINTGAVAKWITPSSAEPGAPSSPETLLYVIADSGSHALLFRQSIGGRIGLLSVGSDRLFLRYAGNNGNNTASFLNFTGWVPLNMHRVAADVVVSNTVTETSVYSFSVPAQGLRGFGALRVTILGTWLQNSGAARDMTIRCKYGATTIATAIVNVAASATTNQVKIDFVLMSDGLNNAQVGKCLVTHGKDNTSTTNLQGALGGGTAAIDSSVAQTLDITIQHASATATNTFTMQTGYTITEGAFDTAGVGL